jgi:hypothetical protein
MELGQTVATAGGQTIAFFGDRLILNAQPPITDIQLREIEMRVGRSIPAGLISLWRTAYGGRLDYALDVDFDGHVAEFSLSELFFPDSEGYHDLWGWIEHEFNCAEEAEDENAKRGVLSFLPFGGFEYLDRVYVCLDEGENYGAVFAWMRGLPPAWSLRLHEDSLARIADDVPALFHMLALEADPFRPDRPEYCSGCEMVDVIEEIRREDEGVADQLADMVRVTVLDWQSSLKAGDIAQQPRLRRLALHDAAQRGDLGLVDTLFRQGCDLNERFAGGGNLLDHFLAHGHDDGAKVLIESGVDPSNAILASAATASVASIKGLLDLGAKVDTTSARTAALQGHPESAILMIDKLAENGGWDLLKAFPAELEHYANQYRKYPISVRSTDENEAAVTNIRTLQSHVLKRLRNKKLGKLPIIGKLFER